MPSIIRKEPQRPWKTKRPAQEGRKAPRDPRYKTAAWQRLRESVLRNQPLCQWCESKGRVREATVVDHIQRVRDGGDFWSGPFQSLCTHHHAVKSGREAHDKTKT